jgi:hypothetical protein
MTLKKTLYETVSVRVAKQKPGSYVASRTIRDWYCGGVGPLRNVEEPTRVASVREAGNVRAPTTLDSFVPNVGTKKYRKRFMFVHQD